MKSNFTTRSSLKTRITLVSLVVFVVSIWSLEFYFSRVLQKDLQRELGEQQLSTVSILASQINNEILLRFSSLKKIAEQITPAILNNASKLQTLLEYRPILDILFNGGYLVTQADGTAVASLPVSTGWIGTNFSDRDWMTDALKGKATIGKPVIGKKVLVPVFAMASPIRDSGGKVIGVLVGVTDLSKPNFLDSVVDNKYGKTGGFLLAVPQHNLIVTATDKKRIMQPLPAPAVNPLLDRYKQGFEGFGRAVNSLGVEELTASKKIPAAGWSLIVKTPIKEAFAPFYDTQQHFIVATIILTLLVGCVIWWMLKHQLSPIFTTVETLTRMSSGSQPADLLPVVRQDEIGLLVSGFNTLLKTKELQEASLKKERNRAQSYLDTVEAIIISLDDEAKIVTINRKACQIFGYEEHELLGQNWFKTCLPQPEGMEKVYPYYLKLMAGKVEGAEYLENAVATKSGELRQVAWHNALLHNEQGKICGVLSAGEDITERKLAEGELHRTKAILQAALDQSPAGIAIADAPDGKLRYVNDAGLLIRDSDRQAVINGIGIEQYVNSWKLFDLDGRQLGIDEVPLARAVMYGEANSREFIIRRKEGEDRIVLANAAPICDEAGKVAAGIVVFTDITERKHNEEQLKGITQRLSLATTSAHLGVWDWNVRDNIMIWDDRMFELYGVKPDTFSSNIDAWTNGLHPDDKDRAFAECQAALNGEQEYDTVFRVLHLDGTEMYIKANAIVIRGTDGKAVRMLGINSDITESKLAEQKLLESEERFKMMFRHHSAVMLLVEPESGEIIDANLAAEKFYGYSHEELLSTNINHINTLTPELISLERQAAINEKRNHFIFQHRLSDGEIRTVEVYSTPITVNKSNLLFSIIQDITSRKRAEAEKQELEQQFQHTQKLESLGVLSGGIAHDFNNILAIIIGYCGLIKMDYDTADKHIPLIETAAERAAGLCRQMLTYAGKAQLTKSKVNMVTKVGEIVNMLKSTLPQNTVIHADLSAEIPIIEGDTSQLTQIAMNLIINASEAIGTEQGEVDVSLDRITILSGKSYEDYHGKPIPPGEYVCLEVTDNGCGMDEETKWRIFEPFYTTKFTGRGLGMSAVLGIIKSHNGALQLFSQLGHGTTFKVYLPVPKKDSTEDGDHKHTPSEPWQGSGTILLVEDEDQVRLISKALLINIGFTVLEAVNGKEALELYQKNATDITLVMTDMGMPIMNGYELFSELKKLNPELPIIVSSGYGDAEVGSRLGTDNIAGIISKPYGPNQLRKMLKGVIEGTR